VRRLRSGCGSGRRDRRRRLEQQLLRFPLSGGNAERPLAITGMPSWSRSRLTMGAVPDAIGGTDSAALLTWPLEAGASNLWGTFVLVGLNGRYLRTVVGPGKWKVRFHRRCRLWRYCDGARHSKRARERVGEISACQSGGNLAWLSLDGARNVSYPNPQGPRDQYCAPQPCGRFDREQLGRVHRDKVGATKSGGTTCSATAAPALRVDAARLGDSEHECARRSVRPAEPNARHSGAPAERRGTVVGTLVVKEPGHQITVASNVLGVTVRGNK